VSTLYVLGSGAAVVRESSLLAGIIQLAVGVLIILAVMGVANAVMRRVPRWHTTVFISTALLLQVPVVAAYALSTIGDASPDSVVGMLANVIAGLVVILATSAFGAVSRLSAQRLDAMAAELNREFIEATARSQSLAGLLREAGGIVHGAVQSRILGCAMAIEEAGRNRDPEQFSAALTRALDALENPVPTLGRPRASTVLDELSRRSGLWEGLCEVEYVVGAEVSDLAPETIDAIGRITEEAIANAVRHGEAQHVVVTVSVDRETTDPARLLLTISDDGIGPSSTAPVAGLGMQLIGSLAESCSLHRESDRTLLSVHLSQT
jgi:signal transduction histidine kinase